MRILTRNHQILCVLFAGILPLLVQNLAHAEAVPVPIVEVQATGTHSVAPDMAVLTMSVVSEAKSAREALNKNNASMNAVIKAMKVSGILSRDLQTSGFSISPRMVYPKRSSQPAVPTIEGYRVNNGLTVRVRKLNELGKILDQSVTLGVNQGGSITFTNDKRDLMMSRAREQAMKNAIAKAKTLTSAAGVRLSSIVSIRESVQRLRAMPMAQMRSMAAESDAVPVQSGESSYAVTVTVSWEITQ